MTKTPKVLKAFRAFGLISQVMQFVRCSLKDGGKTSDGRIFGNNTTNYFVYSTSRK
jgi:hypothetical protein